LMQVARSVDVPIPTTLRDDIEAEALAAPIHAMPEVAILAVLATAIDSQRLAERAARAAEDYRLAPGLYRNHARVPVPDAESSVIGLIVTGRLEADGGTAFNAFSDASGTWLFPPGTPDVSHGVTVETTYLGFVLAGRIDPAGWLP